jgi:Tfp pilus assembly protein PilN
MQEINLYQPASKGVRGMLSASSTAIVFGVIGVTLCGLWGFAWWQIDRLRDAVQVVRNQQAAQAAMVAAEGPQLDDLTDEELDALIRQLEVSVDSKSRAVELLATESQGVPNGFSTRLRAFGERHIDGIWLDRLMLGASVDAVSVSGSTLSPDSVPRYLRSLAQDPALKGGKIDEFVIEKLRKKDKDGNTVVTSGRLSFSAGNRELAVPAAPTSDEEPG